jgi:hypothetical protein
MSYHRFLNLRESFQQDLYAKLMANVTSLDFRNGPCNCKDQECKYGDVCCHYLIVYKVQCKNMGKIYIGNTQQHLKKKMGQHARDVQRKKELKINSDTFASHFGDKMRLFPDFSHRRLRNMMTCSIIWQANPHSALRSFGTPNYILCSREMLEIVKMQCYKPDLLINSCTEI